MYSEQKNTRTTATTASVMCRVRRFVCLRCIYPTPWVVKTYSLVANLQLSPTVKEFLKSVDIFQSSEFDYRVASFYGSQCIADLSAGTVTDDTQCFTISALLIFVLFNVS